MAECLEPYAEVFTERSQALRAAITGAVVEAIVEGRALDDRRATDETAQSATTTRTSERSVEVDLIEGSPFSQAEGMTE